MALPKLETPTFELTLPSSKQKLRYRPFLVKEHKVLLTMAEADDSEVARIIKELIDVCTFNTLNVNTLPHFDIEYIFMNLRAKSIGENVEVIITCDCGTKTETSFNIDNLKVEVKEDHSNKIMITDDIGIVLKYPNIEDVLKVYTNDENKSVFDIVISSIEGVYSKDEYWDAKNQTKEELEEFIFSLTKDQFSKLEVFFTTSPKIVQTIESDCVDCGKHNISRLEGLQNFFV
jgi:hypothetical protein